MPTASPTYDPMRERNSALAEASPEDKRAIYDELGVTLTYQPDR